MYVKQNSFLYFPTNQTECVYEEEVFPSDNESISTTVLNIGQNKAIIYFGGNAENVDNNANNFSKIFKDYTVYLVKYRGYGSSTGKPTEKGLYSDTLKIYDAIKSKYANISIIGRSLGTGVATYLASKRKIDKLVLVTPFDSLQSIAQELFPIYPMSLLLKDKYNSIDRVRKIKAYTLVLIAEKDQTIKRVHTENLVKKFPASQISFKVIKNAGHNSISNSRLYYTLLKKYFQNI